MRCCSAIYHQTPGIVYSTVITPSPHLSHPTSAAPDATGQHVATAAQSATIIHHCLPTCRQHAATVEGHAPTVVGHVRTVVGHAPIVVGHVRTVGQTSTAHHHQDGAVLLCCPCPALPRSHACRRACLALPYHTLPQRALLTHASGSKSSTCASTAGKQGIG